MSDQQKSHGTVKWFSNKKGYGFITPDDGSSDNEIFVHQTSIHSEGYRTLDEGWEVEFIIGKDEEGKIKAENVTAPGGGPCTGPRSSRRRGWKSRRKEKKREGSSSNGQINEGEGKSEEVREVRAPKSPWHHILNEDVKSAMEAKGIRTKTGTIDIAVGSARIKLGTRSYSSMAHADGILAEGTFDCDSGGHATFEWKHCIRYDKGEGAWKPFDVNSPELLPSLALSDDSVVAVRPEETAVTLWGDGPTDPRSSLKENGFAMRHVVLTARIKT